MISSEQDPTYKLEAPSIGYLGVLVAAETECRLVQLASNKNSQTEPGLNKLRFWPARLLEHQCKPKSYIYKQSDHPDCFESDFEFFFHCFKILRRC